MSLHATSALRALGLSLSLFAGLISLPGEAEAAIAEIIDAAGDGGNGLERPKDAP